MRGSFRDTPKIIFRMGRVKTIDKFIARSFDIFHRATSVLPSVPQREHFNDSRSTCRLFIAMLRRLCGTNSSTTPCQN